MKKKAAEIIVKMADDYGNILFDEPEFCSLYERANKYLLKLLDDRIKRARAKRVNVANLTEKEIDDIIARILEP